MGEKQSSPDAKGWPFEYNNVTIRHRRHRDVLMALRPGSRKTKKSYEDFSSALWPGNELSMSRWGWAAFDKDSN